MSRLRLQKHTQIRMPKKISSAVRHRLPDWIEATVRTVIAAALQKAGLKASLTLAGKDKDKLILTYPAVQPAPI